MTTKLLLGGIAAITLAACTTDQQAVPLIFGRTQTVGISVAGTVPDQGAHLTIGFSDRNVAIVPTTAPNGDQIRGTGRNGNFSDALSVLGQFHANAKASDVSAGLGTFFSTGNAARLLAEGFSCQLGAGQRGCGGDGADDAGDSSNSSGNSSSPQ